MGSYVPNTPEERLRMLGAIGVSSEDALYQSVPASMKGHAFDLPEGMSEMEVAGYMTALAGRNRVYGSIFRGAGAYDHYIPAIVKSVTGKEEFLTAYTPYQAEISQGVLRSIFEYQTMICMLTGMDVANASVYDGATAAAEAAAMCRDRRRDVFVMSAAANPAVIGAVRTYFFGSGMELVLAPEKDGKTDLAALAGLLDARTAGVYIQQPNYYGQIEDAAAAGDLAHQAGAKFVMGVNPIAMGLLKTPAECGADIAVGEGQPLGLPLSFGGPYLGFMASTTALMRKLPGRIVGETSDHEGRKAYVLTLQAREQHIRREKAASNICSNEALCAMTAAVYMAALGGDGLREVARQCASKAHYMSEKIAAIPGFSLRDPGAFFHEFVTGCPVDPAALNRALSEADILGGLPVDGGILWCATEKNTKAEIDRLVSILAEVAA